MRYEFFEWTPIIVLFYSFNHNLINIYILCAYNLYILRLVLELHIFGTNTTSIFNNNMQTKHLTRYNRRFCAAISNFCPPSRIEHYW